MRLLIGIVSLAAPALLCASAHASEKLKPFTVEVTNHRQTPVVSLGFAPDGGSAAPVNQLKKPIPSGKSAKVTIRAKKDVCSFTVSGAYGDGEEISGSGLNLCDDRVLALVD